MQHFFLLIYLSCLQKKNNYIYKISNHLNIHIDWRYNDANKINKGSIVKY